MSNKANVGDLFIFVHNKHRLEIHFITKVIPATNRLTTWVSNKGHEKRNLLFLNAKPIVVPWGEVKALNYTIRGTIVVRKPTTVTEIIDYVTKKIKEAN
jgi:hypothetical protein